MNGQKSAGEAKRVRERLRVVILFAIGERMAMTLGVEAWVLLLNLIRSRLGRVRQASAADSRIDGEKYPELSHIIASR